MSAVIYKAGQGYWVRSLSAVFFGALVLAAAAWGWGQAGAVDLPIRAYSYRVAGASAPAAVGSSLDLLALDENDVTTVIATGTVEACESQGDDEYAVRVGSLQPAGGLTVRAIDPSRVSSASGFAGRVDGPAQAHTVVPAVFLQGGIAGVIIAAGSAAILWFVGLGRGSVEFLIATDGEMKKVNWSTRREIIGSTWVVIVAAFLVASVLFVIDSGFSSVFRAIGVIPGG